MEFHFSDNLKDNINEKQKNVPRKNKKKENLDDYCNVKNTRNEKGKKFEYSIEWIFIGSCLGKVFYG